MSTKKRGKVQIQISQEDAIKQWEQSLKEEKQRQKDNKDRENERYVQHTNKMRPIGYIQPDSDLKANREYYLNLIKQSRKHRSNDD